ncbi:hypothetical protein [Mesorhizobium sp.]|nr:hypothetical protein [Mesorhizobium sp.]
MVAFKLRTIYLPDLHKVEKIEYSPSSAQMRYSALGKKKPAEAGQFE